MYANHGHNSFRSIIPNTNDYNEKCCNNNEIYVDVPTVTFNIETYFWHRHWGICTVHYNIHMEIHPLPVCAHNVVFGFIIKTAYVLSIKYYALHLIVQKDKSVFVNESVGIFFENV